MAREHGGSTLKSPFAGLFAETQGMAQRMCEQLELQTNILSGLYEHGYLQAEVDEFHWIRASQVADANGNANIPLENRVGKELELVSWASVCGSASSGGIVFAFGNVPGPQNNSLVEPQNVFWTASVTQYSSDKFTGGMIVPVNGVVTVQFLACGAGVTCFANLLTKQVTKRKQEPYRSLARGW